MPFTLKSGFHIGSVPIFGCVFSYFVFVTCLVFIYLRCFILLYRPLVCAGLYANVRRSVSFGCVSVLMFNFLFSSFMMSWMYGMSKSRWIVVLRTYHGAFTHCLSILFCTVCSFLSCVFDKFPQTGALYVSIGLM